MSTENALSKTGDGNTGAGTVTALTDPSKTTKTIEATTDGDSQKKAATKVPAKPSNEKKATGKGMQPIVEPEQYMLMKADGTYVILAPISVSQVPAALKNRTLKRVEVV